MRVVVLLLLVWSLSGCSGLGNRLPWGKDAAAEPAAPISAAELVRPPSGARTAEAFDTTTPAQRAAATQAQSGARLLGTTIVSLGNPAEPGFWMKTPLVLAQTPGQVRNPATGQSVAVTLIPIEGPATAGSRMSLPALRLIGAGLGALTEVEVSVTG